MGDMGDLYRDLRDHHRQRRETNLAKADPAGWTQHTEHHWSRTLAGHRIDYWPSRNKFQYLGRVMTGDVQRFIARRTPKE